MRGALVRTLLRSAGRMTPGLARWDCAFIAGSAGTVGASLLASPLAALPQPLLLLDADGARGCEDELNPPSARFGLLPPPSRGAADAGRAIS